MRIQSLKLFMRTYGVIMIVVWTTVIMAVTSITLYIHHQGTVKIADHEARGYYRIDQAYRAWVEKLGGVYAPLDKVEPNPHLNVSRRDVITTDGQRLTLINPVYMTRLVFESLMTTSGTPVISKLTSLQPLNPINMPDKWEREALTAIEKGEINDRSEVVLLKGTPYLRMISKFTTEDACLNCHAQQGYRLGDVRGAISISVPYSNYTQTEFRMRNNIVAGYLLLWGIGCLGITISSRRRFMFEEKIRSSEQKFRTVCDWTQDWEYWADPGGVMLYVSPSCEQITGYGPGDFIGDPDLILRVIHPEDRELCEQHHSHLLPDSRSGAAEMEFRIIRKNGDVRWIHHVCRPVFSGSDYLGRRASNRDVTEIKKAEEGRHRLEQQMLHVQKLESLGVLAGGIAHDFNNLLLAITGNASLALRRMTPGAPAEHHLKQIEVAADKAADLARQMLAYSGKGAFVFQAVDLNQLVEEMTTMLEVSISKKAALRYYLTKPLPPIEADVTQIQQVIMNLIINASEAIGEKNGVISISTGCMECDRKYLSETWLVENLQEGPYVYLEVSDNGCGMDRSTIEKIFEPFFTTKFTGRGLGMAAILGIVRGHKGAIKVYSEPGKGSTFKILLPAGQRPVELAATADTGSGWRGTGTVLLVDDEESIRDVGSEMLRELGFNVVCAVDGTDALHIYRQRQDEIGLVILDLTMPHMSGDETFRELRRINPNVQVVMSSGFSAQEVSQKFMGKGLVGFVQKPYNISKLQDILSRINS